MLRVTFQVETLLLKPADNLTNLKHKFFSQKLPTFSIKQAPIYTFKTTTQINLAEKITDSEKFIPANQ